MDKINWYDFLNNIEALEDKLKGLTDPEEITHFEMLIRLAKINQKAEAKAA